MRRPDPRTPEAALYRKWYNSKEWRRARTVQLAEHPLCEPCEARGLIVPATVANHRKPHKGDWALFIDAANHQSTCKPCHDGPIQAQERAGRQYDSAVGADGWPVDARHPFLAAGKPKTREGRQPAPCAQRRAPKP